MSHGRKNRGMYPDTDEDQTTKIDDVLRKTVSGWCTPIGEKGASCGTNES